MRFAPHSALGARALEAVRTRPRSTAWLAREILRLRMAPPGLAARMVFELLGGDRRLRVDGRGMWRLALAPTRQGPALEALRFAVVDVETTGLSARRGGRVLEIGLVEMCAGEIVGEFQSLVNPGCAVPWWISRLTGITTDMVRGAPTFEEISEPVCRRLEGKVFVAHNASFDWAFLVEEMRRARSLLPSGPRLCTLRLARRALPGLRRRGLDSLSAYYGVSIDGRHRAGGDALATAHILRRLLIEADRRGIHSWGALQEWLAGREPPPPAAENGRPSGRRPDVAAEKASLSAGTCGRRP